MGGHVDDDDDTRPPVLGQGATRAQEETRREALGSSLRLLGSMTSGVVVAPRIYFLMTHKVVVLYLGSVDYLLKVLGPGEIWV